MLGQLWLTQTLPKLPANAPVYVAPPVTYGKSVEHADFAGTVTITARTLRRQLIALATQLKAFGFQQIAILNTRFSQIPRHAIRLFVQLAVRKSFVFEQHCYIIGALLHLRF